MDAFTSTVVSKDLKEVGLLDEIFAQLPARTRNHLLFNWALSFQSEQQNDTQSLKHNQDFVDIIGSLSTLDFSYCHKISCEQFVSLESLPLRNITHLDLSHSPLASSSNQVLEFVSRSPAFTNLESLNLSKTKVKSLNALLKGPHAFPKLHSLILHENPRIDLESFSNTSKFPSLTCLDLNWTVLADENLEMIAESPKIAFKVKEFELDKSLQNQSDALMVLKSPPFNSITHLSVAFNSCLTNQFIENIANGCGEANAAVKCGQLTHLDITGSKMDTGILSPLCSSPLVSNLVSLRCRVRASDKDLGTVGSLGDEESGEVLHNSCWDSIKQSSYFPTTLKNLEVDLNRVPATKLLKDFNLNLESFKVINAEWCFGDIEMMCANPMLSNLVKLSLRGKYRHQPHPSSTACNNDDNNQGISEVNIFTPFSKSTNFSKLTHFNISIPAHNGIPPGIEFRSDLKSLLRSDTFSNDLVELSLGFIEIDAECVEILTTQRVNPNDPNSPLKYGKLRKLSLLHSKITSSSISHLAKLSQLQQLSFSQDDGLGDDIAEALVQNENDLPMLPKFANLRRLHLFLTEMALVGALKIAKSRLMDNLEEITLNLDYDEREKVKEALQESGQHSNLILFNSEDFGRD